MNTNPPTAEERVARYLFDREWTRVIDVDAARELIELMQPAVPSSPLDQTLRDRIAEAPCVCGEPGTPNTRHRADGPCYVVDERLRVAALAIARTEAHEWANGGRLEDMPLWQSYLARAAAVLGVLPPADRAAVLLGAADHLDARAAAFTAAARKDPLAFVKGGTDARYRTADCWNAAAEELRRLAAEAPQPETETPSELASLAMNAARALQDEKRHYEIACQENASLRATVERVRQLHDRLAEETDLASPDDSITRGAAAKRIATALDGWNPTNAPQCDVEFENGARCAKPAGHRPPSSDDPHVPAPAAAGPGRAADTRDDEETHNSGPGWYEVINPRNATTNIALVQEDGSLYLPEGDALTPDEFAFAAARGNAHRLTRADEGADRG